MRVDMVIIIANAIGLALLGGILFFKVGGPQSSHETNTPAGHSQHARGS